MSEFITVVFKVNDKDKSREFLDEVNATAMKDSDSQFYGMEMTAISMSDEISRVERIEDAIDNDDAYDAIAHIENIICEV